MGPTVKVVATGPPCHALSHEEPFVSEDWHLGQSEESHPKFEKENVVGKGAS